MEKTFLRDPMRWLPLFRRNESNGASIAFHLAERLVELVIPQQVRSKIPITDNVALARQRQTENPNSLHSFHDTMFPERHTHA